MFWWKKNVQLFPSVMFSLFTDLCSGSVQVHLRLPMKYLWNSVCVCLNNRCSFKKTSRKIFKPFPQKKKSFSIFFIETKIQTSFAMKHTIYSYGVLLMFFCFILNKVYAILKKLKSQTTVFHFEITLECIHHICWWCWKHFFINDTFRGTILLSLASLNLLYFVCDIS